jgi:hypothetical protein
MNIICRVFGHNDGKLKKKSYCLRCGTKIAIEDGFLTQEDRLKFLENKRKWKNKWKLPKINLP